MAWVCSDLDIYFNHVQSTTGGHRGHVSNLDNLAILRIRHQAAASCFTYVPRRNRRGEKGIVVLLAGGLGSSELYQQCLPSCRFLLHHRLDHWWSQFNKLRLEVLRMHHDKNLHCLIIISICTI